MSESKDLDQEKIKKTEFWARRALSAISEMRHNKETSLFPKSEGWRNVVEHELIEAEAVDVLGEKLGLSDEERKNLRTAALLHDVFKRKEIERARVRGPSAFEEVAEEEKEWIKSLGYSSEIVELVGSVALPSFRDFNEKFDTISTTRKIIHYVDDITLSSDIVTLEKRVSYVVDNPEYKELNESGKAVFGRLYTDVQLEISKRIEAEFAPRLGVSNPSAIPAFIKDSINSRIDQNK